MKQVFYKTDNLIAFVSLPKKDDKAILSLF